jgi:glycosyltransferase involved in cell wall biosynthesis
MEILFVCPLLPHPNVRHSGGQDVYHYIVSLAERHSVSLIAFVSPTLGDALASMRGVCKEVVAVPHNARSPMSRLLRTGWKLFLPAVYGRTVSFSYRRALQRLLSSRRFDAVIVDGSMALYGRSVSHAAKVLDAVDLYSMPAYHIYRNESRLVHRMWAFFNWLRTQALELDCASTYDAVLVRSEKDREILQNYLPEQRVEVLAPWFEGLDELRAIAPSRPEGNRVLFMGAMGLQPNIEAVIYFGRKVLPLIRQQVPDVEFEVVGSAPAKQVLQLGAEESIHITGEVESLAASYERSAVNVVPLLTGGGIIVKTLNGMAAARPTVATRAGMSGIEAEPGRDLLVVDQTPEAFARAVVKLLVDRELWTQIALNGRQFVAGQYDWDGIIGRLDALLVQINR